MPYNPDYTYILVRIHGQSNHLGRSLLSSIPNSGIYAPYSGLSSSYQLKGTSSNSVKVWHESELKEATLENYNLNTLLIDSTTFTDHANRLTTNMGSWLSCINDVRAALDADGNNNDLIVYGNARGGMSAVPQPDSMSLDVDEFTRLGLNAFIEYVLSSGISNPYLIFSMNQGESDSTSPATAAAALVSWNKWQVDLKERFGYAPPFIVNSPDWDRTDIISNLETYIANNTNVYSSFGTTLADSIDEIESLHNATGVGTAIDKTNAGTYTIDGTHFNYAANIQSGKIEALKIRELATGFGDSVITPKTYVIVASGESTMVGRANDYDALLDTTDPRITQWGRISPNDGVEILADDPLQHNDSAQASGDIGVAMEYARNLLPTLNSSDKIIIVPVARGGSGYYNNEHGTGNVLYTDTVARVNAVIALDPANTVVKKITAIGINDGFYNHPTFQADFDADDANYRNDFTGNQSEMMHLVLGIIPVWNDGAGIDAAHDVLKTAGDRLFNTTYVQWDDGLPISGADKHPNGTSNRTMGVRLNTFDVAFTAVTPYAPATAPTNLTVTDGTEELTVSFDAVDFANSYVVQYKLSTDTTYTDIVTTNTSIVISSLTSSVSYDVRVKARNPLGDSASTSVIVGTPTAPTNREAGAVIHHLFGTDYATLEDIQGGGALVPNGSSPTNGTGETTTVAGINGLGSAVQMDRTSQTVIVVVKIDNTAGLPGSFMGGNITSNAGQGGFGFYEYAGDVAVQFRGTSAGGVLTTTPDFTNYVFLAATLNNFQHHGYYQDSNGQKVYNNYVGSVTLSTEVIGAGNMNVTNSNFQLGTSVAEFIIFDTPKTESELDDIYARSVSRLAARGITV